MDRGGKRGAKGSIKMLDHARRDSNPQPPDSKSDALPLRHGRVAVCRRESMTVHKSYVFTQNFAVCAHFFRCALPLLSRPHPTVTCHCRFKRRHLLDLHIGIIGENTSLAAASSDKYPISSPLILGAISLISQRSANLPSDILRHCK